MNECENKCETNGCIGLLLITFTLIVVITANLNAVLLLL